MEEHVTLTENQVETKTKKEPKKVNVIACKNCGLSNVTLIKATDSYYCKFCFKKLKKKKFEK